MSGDRWFFTGLAVVVFCCIGLYLIHTESDAAKVYAFGLAAGVGMMIEGVRRN